MTARLDDLDDPDYPAYTTGRAAEVLGVRQAFLRALDAAGAVTPQRTAGGRRRYTRRQLAFAARIRELFDQGHTLAAALRILALEDDLAAERALTARLHDRLAGQDRPGRGLIRAGPGILPAAGGRAGPCALARDVPVLRRGGRAVAGQCPQAGQLGLQLRVSSCSCRTRRMPARFRPSAVRAQISCSRSMSRREYRRVPPALRAGSSSPSRS